MIARTCIAAALVLLAAPAAAKPQAVSLAGVESVEIRSRSGDLRVLPSEDPAVLLVSGEGVEVEAEGTQVVISFRDDLTVRLPPVGRLTVAVRSGDVELRVHPRRLRVTSVSGDVDVVSGPLEEADVESFSGDVTWRGDVERLSITAVSGTVAVRGEVGEAQLKSTSGDVSVQGARLPRRLDASTVAGDIDLKGELQREAVFVLHTTSGDVRLRYSGEVPPRVNARSHRGGVPAEPAGRAADGAAEVAVTTFSGSVRVDRAE
jgi:DUF4097 and DUF4098 domain-containing protein YvlB